MKKPILVDCDGVLTQGFYEKCIESINERFSKNYKLEDLYTDLRFVMPEWDEEMDKMIRSPGFCRDMKPDPLGVKMIDKFKEMNLRIVYVTSPYSKAPTWCQDRTDWLEEHFGATRDDVIFARDKRYVDGICLIDDLPKNVINWGQYRNRPGKMAKIMANNPGVLWRQPWNMDFKEEDGCPVLAVSNLDELFGLVNLIANREMVYDFNFASSLNYKSWNYEDNQ